MTFEEFQTQRATIEARLTAASVALAAYPKAADGLTPDATKAMPGWRAARDESRAAFEALRAFNGRYAGQFAKEIKADIAARRAAALASRA